MMIQKFRIKHGATKKCHENENVSLHIKNSSRSRSSGKN